MNTISITAAEVREGDLILSTLHGNQPYEVGGIEVITLRHNLSSPGTPPSKVDQRLFTWRTPGAAKFHRGLYYDATEMVEVIR